MNSNYSTICRKMWNSVFISVTGNVYFCCRKSPGPLGNIFHQHLDDIWQGAVATEYRRQSLYGMLTCHKNCTLLSAALKSILPEAIEAGAPAIQKVHIEHHEFCNIDCIMCYQHDGRKPRYLPNEILKDHIKFSELKEVQLQGGEPLAYKPCRELFHWILEELSVPVTLQTNGLLIDEALATLIAKRCVEIMVALNAATPETHEYVNRGSNWDTVMRSIELLKNAKYRHNSDLCIEGQMTLVRENLHELPEFIQMADRIGLDSISVSWEESVPEYLEENPALFHDIRTLLEPLLGSLVFKKQKHIERLCILFDFGNENPMVRLGRLPRLQRTETYRGLQAQAGKGV